MLAARACGLCEHPMRMRALVAWVVMLAVITGGASAETPAASDPQKAARALFDSGNERFENNDFVRASELYRQALEQWDQPVIRFNLAVTLIELDRSREAYDHLLKVVEQGAGTLGTRQAEARNYLRLLRARLSTISVTFDPAARCEIDGTEIKRGAAIVLEPGSHTLVARRAGFEPYTRTLVLEPGGKQELAIELQRPRTRLVRRWSTAIPWLVFGGGAVAALAGGSGLFLANRRIDEVNADLARGCAAACTQEQFAPYLRRSDRAERLQLGGGVTLAIGGAVALTGLVLVYLNQPHAESVSAPVGVAVVDRGALLTWHGSL